MVPNGWELKALENLASVERGKFSARPRNDPKYYGGEIPFVQTGDIVSAKTYLKSYSQTLNEEGLKVSRLFPKNTILITIAANIGDVAITSFDVACPDSLVAIQAKESINVVWLYFYLETCQQELDGQATQNAQKNINLQVLRPLKILTPPHPEQQKIAKILSTWDKAISTTERLIDNSTQQKKALMQQLLTGKKRLLDDEGKRFESEWEVVKLQSVLDLMRSGLSRKLENDNVGIAVIRSNNMGSKYTSNVDLKYWYLDDPQGANVSNYILDDGDLLVNFINSLSQIGKACIYRKNLDVDAIYTTNILRIKPNTDKVDPIYLYLLTQTANYDSYITSITKPAVNQASFTTKEFGNLEFNLPPLKEQQKIATVLTNADKEIELLEQQLADLQQEKKALMQVLLTGKKRVVV